MKRRTEKFPPEEVDFLLTVAQGRDKSDIPSQHAWIKRLTAVEARDILLYRFHSIIVSLNEVCLKGKFWTSYTKTFLRLFSRQKPLQELANMLKRELSVYTKEELFHTGQVAVLLAIQECKSNLASTIVYQFKEQIAKLLEDKNRVKDSLVNLDESIPYEVDFEKDVCFRDFLENLTDQEWFIAQKLIKGEKLEEGQSIPITLVLKLKDYITL